MGDTDPNNTVRWLPLSVYARACYGCGRDSGWHDWGCPVAGRDQVIADWLRRLSGVQLGMVAAWLESGSHQHGPGRAVSPWRGATEPEDEKGPGESTGYLPRAESHPDEHRAGCDCPECAGWTR